VTLERTTKSSSKILVVVGPQPTVDIRNFISQIEENFSTVTSTVDISQPRPLPAVAESFFDGICLDIAVSAQGDGALPDVIVALPTNALDHQTAMCALALGRWCDAKTILASTAPLDVSQNEYSRLSLAKSQELRQKFTRVGGVENVVDSITSLRGNQS